MSYTLPDLRYQSMAVDPQIMLGNYRRDLDLKISVGIWYFTPGGGRFHDRYVKAASIPEKIEMAADMAYGNTHRLYLSSHAPETENHAFPACNPVFSAARCVILPVVSGDS